MSAVPRETCSSDAYECGELLHVVMGYDPLRPATLHKPPCTDRETCAPACADATKKAYDITLPVPGAEGGATGAHIVRASATSPVQARNLETFARAGPVVVKVTRLDPTSPIVETQAYNEIVVGDALARHVLDPMMSPGFARHVDWWKCDEEPVKHLKLPAGDYQYIVLEQLAGSISEHLKQNQTVEAVRGAAFQVLHALDVAHAARGFVHQDMHRENIMYEALPRRMRDKTLAFQIADGRWYRLGPAQHCGRVIKLIDFGRSRMVVDRVVLGDDEHPVHGLQYVEGFEHYGQGERDNPKKDARMLGWELLDAMFAMNKLEHICGVAGVRSLPKRSSELGRCESMLNALMRLGSVTRLRRTLNDDAAAARFLTDMGMPGAFLRDLGLATAITERAIVFDSPAKILWATRYHPKIVAWLLKYIRLRWNYVPVSYGPTAADAFDDAFFAPLLMPWRERADVVAGAVTRQQLPYLYAPETLGLTDLSPPPPPLPTRACARCDIAEAVALEDGGNKDAFCSRQCQLLHLGKAKTEWL